MQIRVFTIPINDSGEFNIELNKFLSLNKIIEVEQQFINNGERSLWSFCVRYIATSMPTNVPREKIDYKNVLTEKEFAQFSKLREIRKELAVQDAVPAYAVFTDEELSKIAQSEKITIAQLRQIKGIGERKIEKYGEKLITQYNEATGIFN